MNNPLKLNEGKTNLKHNVWFDRLLNIQKIFGLTYSGSCDKKSERIYYLKKVLLSLYEIIITILVLCYMLSIAFTNRELNSQLYIKSSRKKEFWLYFFTPRALLMLSN